MTALRSLTLLLSTHSHTHTHTTQTLLRAPLQCINQLCEEWAWQQLRGGPEHIYHLRNKNNHHEGTESSNTPHKRNEANRPLKPNYLTTLVVSGVVVNLSLNVCMCALWQCYATEIYRAAYQRFTWIYPSNYRRALSLEIISCQEQLLLNAADNSQTCCSICTAA